MNAFVILMQNKNFFLLESGQWKSRQIYKKKILDFHAEK